VVGCQGVKPGHPGGLTSSEGYKKERGKKEQVVWHRCARFDRYYPEMRSDGLEIPQF